LRDRFLHEEDRTISLDSEQQNLCGERNSHPPY
jgi:hypothetical protein